VGVVANSHDFALDREPTAVMFEAFGSMRPPTIDSGQVLIHYVLRTTSASEVVAAAEREIRESSPRATVASAGTVSAKLWQTVRDRSLASLLLSLFGIASTALSAAGLAGIVAFAVIRRTREIAIRAALGAQQSQLRWLVTREALSAALLGSGVGLVIGGVASRGLAHLLYGVEAADPASLALAAAAMLAVAGTAAILPARRANRLSPSDALRIE
jgi:predicted lysophospholipase L1 biosynthesis ABC-type transport system permease subunit